MVPRGKDPSCSQTPRAAVAHPSEISDRCPAPSTSCRITRENRRNTLCDVSRRSAFGLDALTRKKVAWVSPVCPLFSPNCPVSGPECPVNDSSISWTSKPLRDSRTRVGVLTGPVRMIPRRIRTTPRLVQIVQLMLNQLGWQGKNVRVQVFFRKIGQTTTAAPPASSMADAARCLTSEEPAALTGGLDGERQVRFISFYIRLVTQSIHFIPLLSSARRSSP